MEEVDSERIKTSNKDIDPYIEFIAIDEERVIDILLNDTAMTHQNILV